MIQDETLLLNNNIENNNNKIRRLRLYSEAALAQAFICKQSKLSGVIDLGAYLQLTPEDNNNNDPNEINLNQNNESATMPRSGTDSFPQIYDLIYESAQRQAMPDMAFRTAQKPTEEYGSLRKNQKRRRAHSDPIPIVNHHRSLDHFQFGESVESSFSLEGFHCGSPLPSPAPMRHFSPVHDLSTSQLHNQEDDESHRRCLVEQNDFDEIFDIENDEELEDFIITSIENIPGLLESVVSHESKSPSAQTPSYLDQVDSRSEKDLTNDYEEDKEDGDESCSKAHSDDDNQKEARQALAEIGRTLRRISVDFMDSQALVAESSSSWSNSFVSGAAMKAALPGLMLNKLKTLFDSIWSCLLLLDELSVNGFAHCSLDCSTSLKDYFHTWRTMK